MNFVDSFILATAFSYLAACLLPIQFDKKMSLLAQKIMYLVLFAVLVLAVFLDMYSSLWWLLGVIYSFIAVYCFGGGQDWGSINHNIVMGAWDLALAVCLFSKVML